MEVVDNPPTGFRPRVRYQYTVNGTAYESTRLRFGGWNPWSVETVRAELRGEVFTIPRVNVIVSDEGFSVEVLGRTGIDYREGDRSMFVDSEVLLKGIAIFRRSIKAWRPPHDAEPITERERILANIRKAIEFRNEPVEIL
jgi:hypothetical protein